MSVSGTSAHPDLRELEVYLVNALPELGCLIGLVTWSYTSFHSQYTAAQAPRLTYSADHPSALPSIDPIAHMRLLRRLPTAAEEVNVFFHIDPYDLLSILLETLAYGIFLVLFILSTVLLLQRRRAFLRKKVVERVKLRSLTFYLVTGMLMFLTISAKWMFWWPEVLPIHAREPGVAAQIPRLNRTSYRFKEVLMQITILLGDLITIYRLWILSNKNKIMIVFPIAIFFGYLACAIGLSGPANDTTTTPVPIKNRTLQMTDWDVAAVVCTVGITVYITLMIAWIILRARMRVAANVLGNSLNQALVVIAESAAIYTMWNVMFLIAGAGFRNEIALCFLECMAAVYGISVMLINVRVGLGCALRDNERVISTAPIIFMEGGGRRNFLGSSIVPEQRGIHISTVVCTEPSGSSSRCEIADESRGGGDIELGDVRSVASSMTASFKPCAV